MKKNPTFQFGLFNPRVLFAFAFCSVGVLLAMLSFATTDASAPAVAAPPGFHAAVTAAGSGNGSESYVGIPFVGPRTGNRVLAWQVGARYNISPDGVNWNFASAQIPGTSGGGDVSTAVDAFGSYYIMEFCTATQGELQACLHKSTNGGTSWTTTTIANRSPNPIDRPWVEVYPKLGATATITSTAQTMVYLEYHTFTDGQTYLNTSTDGGATFGAPTPAAVGTNTATSDSVCNTVPSGISVDQRNGTAYALWLSGDDVAQNIATGCNITQIGPFNKAWVTKSTNDGLTWQIPSTGPAWTGFYDATTNTGDNANKLFGSVAVDYAGQVHVLVTARKKDQPLQYVTDCQNPAGSCIEAQADTDLVFVTSPDGGVHWTAPRDINLVHDTDNNPNTNKHTYFYPWIYAGAQGMVDAIYYFSATNRPNDPNNSWVTKFSQITGAIANAPGVGGCPPQGPVPIPPAPACYVGAGPQVAQETQVSNGAIHVGGICTFGIFCDIINIVNPSVGDRSLLDANNIAIDPAGGANATWTANSPGSQRVEFVCQNAGRSVFDGVNAPEPFAGDGSAILNGCYGPTDMSITKTDSPDPVAPGGTLTYHLTVTNNGTPAMPATTSGVTVTDVLPAGVTFVSATASSGICSGTSTVTCNLGIFPSGAVATVDIVVTVASNATGTITNTASVAAATSDPNPGNNTASAMTTVSIGPPVPTSVVSRKTHGSLTPPPTGPGDLTLNLDPATAATIEPRSGGAPTGNHLLVFTFLNTLNATTPVTSITATATTSSGTVNVTASGSLGADTHQYLVSLTGVPNACHLAVTLHGVTDTAGNSGDIAPVRMDVLWGDVNSSKRTDNGDAIVIRNLSGTIPSVSDVTSVRADVNISGRVDNGDAIVVRNNSGAVLPP
jgi:uncharacterized repeat protein (TIGR01451 family)